jgi:hypothetical protein
MPTPTTALLTELSRLEDRLGRFPTANDVRRDGTYSVNTYYKRFDGWRRLEDTYQTWQETGDLPSDFADAHEPFDWRSLQGRAEND